jgi:tetratricopeptide (TPR) repeat protein
MKDLALEAGEIAAELSDVEGRALAAAARRRAMWEPAHLEERISDSTELLTLAQQAGDLELTLQGHAWLIVDLLERGDVDAVGAQIEAFSAGAQRLRQPFYVWNAAVWRAMRELLAGRIESADALAREALAAGARAEAQTASQYYAIQLLTVRREQDRLAELEPAARQFVAAAPGVHAWRAALASLLWALGETEEAVAELEVLAAHGFADIPRDGNWMIAVTLLGELCAEMDDADRGAKLYDLLLPFEQLNVVVALAAVCLGSSARYLGLLAATTGRDREAAAHFEQALRANAALKAPVWLAHTQLDYARALGPGPRAQKLIAEAAGTAAELDLAAVARRARELTISVE